MQRCCMGTTRTTEGQRTSIVVADAILGPHRWRMAQPLHSIHSDSDMAAAGGRYLTCMHVCFSVIACYCMTIQEEWTAKAVAPAKKDLGTRQGRMESMAPGAFAEKKALVTKFQSLLGRSTSTTCSWAAVSCAGSAPSESHAACRC